MGAMTDDERLQQIMEERGVPLDVARWILATERGENPRDVVMVDDEGNEIPPDEGED
jgi:hypothetical protein